MKNYMIVSEKEIKKIKNTIDNSLKEIGSFHLINPELVPEGLKPIARSVSWLVEQVVIQNLRKYKNNNNLENVIDPPHNLTQYDCILKYADDDRQYHVNIKTSLSKTSHNSRFDISKAQKLIEFYEQNPDLTLILAIVKIEMEGSKINFTDSIVFNVAWVPNNDIYYNRANHNLQSKCDGQQSIRSNFEFIQILKQKVDEKGHSKHY